MITKKTSVSGSKLLGRNDYLRIKFLFERWVNWLSYLIFVYFFTFLIWKTFSISLQVTFIQVNVFFYRKFGVGIFSCLWAIFAVQCAAFLRGVIFCIDGIVSSWLKSPFGQITYSINKSAIRSSKSDEIVTILTEVNENFKETFKKFGVYTIAVEMGSLLLNQLKNSEVMNTTVNAFRRLLSYKNFSTCQYGKLEFMWNRDNPLSLFNILTNKNSYEFFLISSLAVPVVYAFSRIKEARTLIEGLEVSDD